MIAACVVEAARRAQAKHPILTAEEIAHAIACSYGISAERLPEVEREIVARLHEVDPGFGAS